MNWSQLLGLVYHVSVFFRTDFLMCILKWMPVSQTSFSTVLFYKQQSVCPQYTDSRRYIANWSLTLTDIYNGIWTKKLNKKNKNGNITMGDGTLFSPIKRFRKMKSCLAMACDFGKANWERRRRGFSESPRKRGETGETCRTHFKVKQGKYRRTNVDRLEIDRKSEKSSRKGENKGKETQVFMIPKLQSMSPNIAVLLY